MPKILVTHGLIKSEEKKVNNLDKIDLESINIQPGVSILSTLPSLNYKTWYALAEFVDNAVQSFKDHREMLGNTLEVSIDIDSFNNRISIKDNAGGISRSEFPRAFKPAALPSDASGLNEFGMGMKSAACWFSPLWQVRTKVRGEDVERKIRFDMKKILDNKIEDVNVSVNRRSNEEHYTEVVLEDVREGRLPRKGTVKKLKEHLSDIYREFIRNDMLILRLNNEQLKFIEPDILHVPIVKSSGEFEDGNSIYWRKEIDFDFGNNLTVKGFAALRDVGNRNRSGFALFRRGRLIQGSGDQGYRPTEIFGKENSFRYLRLFGELHIEGFKVSHTKDGFLWDENEEPFLELLKERLNSQEMPMLRQGENYRVKKSKDLKKSAQKALDSTVDVMEEFLPDVLPIIANKPEVETPTEELPQQFILVNREININFEDENWLVKIEITDNLAESQWLKISNNDSIDFNEKVIEIQVAGRHQFMTNFAYNDDAFTGFLRMAAGLALSEILARNSGVNGAGTIRRNLNDIIYEALSYN